MDPDSLKATEITLEKVVQELSIKIDAFNVFRDSPNKLYEIIEELNPLKVALESFKNALEYTTWHNIKPYSIEDLSDILIVCIHLLYRIPILVVRFFDSRFGTEDTARLRGFDEFGRLKSRIRSIKESDPPLQKVAPQIKEVINEIFAEVIRLKKRLSQRDNGKVFTVFKYLEETITDFSDGETESTLKRVYLGKTIPQLGVEYNCEFESQTGATEVPVKNMKLQNQVSRVSKRKRNLGIDDLEGQIVSLEIIRMIVIQNRMTFMNLPATSSDNSRIQHDLRLDWSPTTFMRWQFESFSVKSIASVIVLSGTSLKAQATTCQQYLQDHWPSTYKIVLECFEDSINEGGRCATDGDLELCCWIDTLQVTCNIIGGLDKIVEVVQQLAWLGASLQRPWAAELRYSEARIKTSTPMRVQFGTSPINNDELSCWHSLFNRSIIAKDFPVAERGDEVGLEIPLEMMVALTGIRHAVEYKGGVVLKGHSSAFLPIKRHKDSIQWHYIENDEDVRLSYSDVEVRCPGRAMLDEVSLNNLKGTRAFVGWWGVTGTYLGTEEVNYENIDWSTCNQVSRPMKFSGVTLGFQHIVSGGINFSLGNRDGKLHVGRKGPYQQIIQCAARSPIVLYDICEKRAWLVSSSAVILHVAKTRHHRNPYTTDGNEINFPSAELSVSNHKAAEKVLLEEAPFKLCTADEFGNQGYHLGDLVRDIWSYLEMLLEENVKREETSDPEVRGTMGDILRGWEFMDLVDDKSPFRLKETYIGKSSGGWTDLARDIDAIVLFGSGFEDIIKPIENSTVGLCHTWKSVPKGNDFLAASVPMMNQLYEEAGSKLSRKYLTSTNLRWQKGGELWEPCRSAKLFSCSCNRLQQIVSDKSTQFGHISDPGPLEENGAAIFGEASEPFTSTMLGLFNSKGKQVNTLYSQPNVGFFFMESSSFTNSSLSTDTREKSISSVFISSPPIGDKDNHDQHDNIGPKDPESRSFGLITDEKKKEVHVLLRKKAREDLTLGKEDLVCRSRVR